MAELDDENKSGSLVLYNRKKVRYRRDGYLWKKRKNERTTRVDHMKLKIQGVECIYGSYVHSALIPTFHRRSYWLLQNPDIVLVHYLNIPSLSEESCKVNNATSVSSILPTALPMPPPSPPDTKGSAKSALWQRDDLLQQIKPIFTGTQVQLNGSSLTKDNLSTETDVAEVVVQYLLDLQDQQKQTKEQQSIVFSSLTLKGAPSTAASPQSIASIPPSPMSVQSDAPPSLQAPADPNAVGHAGDLPGTSDQRLVQELLPILLFKSITEVESTGQLGYSIEERPRQRGAGEEVVASAAVTINGDDSSPATSGQSTPTAVGMQCGESMSLRDINGRPLITKEESASLRALVDGDPNLKTCRNRFKNQPGIHHRKVALLPPYIPPPSPAGPKPDPPPTPTEGVDRGRAGGDAGEPPSYDVHLLRRQLSGENNHLPANEVSTATVPSSGGLFQPFHPRTTTLDVFPAFQQSLPVGVPPPPLQLPPPPPYTGAGLTGCIFTFAGASEQSQSADAKPPDPTDNRPSFRPVVLPRETMDAAAAHASGFHPSPARPHDGVGLGQSQPAQPFPVPTYPSGSLLRPVTGSTGDFQINDLDFELDFDADMFDSALAEITLDGTLQVRTPVPDPTNQQPVTNHLTIMHQDVIGSAVQSGDVLPGLQQRGGSVLDRSPKAITEYSPDWSYPEGGVKVLVTGPWQASTGNYQCMFDNFGVPASLVQTGVLRCYCPAHEAGVVALQVFCDGLAISKSAIFEYKARSAQQRPSRQHEWLSLDENQFHVAILDRLEHIERRVVLSNAQGSQQGSAGGPMDQQLSFEDRVVALCQRFMTGQWAACSSSSQLGAESSSNRGMTLLHLAAALGYNRLIRTLVTWRNEQHSLVLEMEVDPLNIDHLSCTPLMWAAALGHRDTAVLLFSWSPQALHVCDSLGRLPIDMAKSRGHTALADCLQRMEFDGPAYAPEFVIGHAHPPGDAHLPGHAHPPGDCVPTPAFMLSSPSTATPRSSSSVATPSELASPYDSPSPSSGCLSQLSVSPLSQGFLSPASFKSHSPRVSVSASQQPPAGHQLPSNYPPKNRTGHGALFGDAMDVDSEPKVRGHDPNKGAPLLDVQQLLRGIENIQRHDNVGCLSEQERLDLMRHADQLRKLGAGMGPEHGPAPTTNGHSTTAGNQNGYQNGTTSGLELFQLGGVVGSSRHGPPDGCCPRCDSPMQTESEGLDAMAGSSAAANSWITETNQKEQYLNLAEQILNALPARIKDVNNAAAPSMGLCGQACGIDCSAGDQESHRCMHDGSSAGSTYSADSCLPSPSHLSLEEESSAADWCEFLQGASRSLGVVGAFSLLTLSDEEQMQLYQAALVIQNAFRQYKGRQQQKQHELEAAVIIQSYYRRYKQYIMYSKMAEAAKVIQSRFRSYNHYRQFQRSRRAAIVIQSHYRGYRAQEQFRKSRDAAILIQQRFRDKRLARQKLQQDAARKIQRFIRRCQNRLRSLRQTRGECKRYAVKKD